jgi:hypothetical protein
LRPGGATGNPAHTLTWTKHRLRKEREPGRSISVNLLMCSQGKPHEMTFVYVRTSRAL